MSEIYHHQLLIKSEQSMKKPRKSTLSFLRDFARAYTALPAVGAIILN